MTVAFRAVIERIWRRAFRTDEELAIESPHVILSPDVVVDIDNGALPSTAEAMVCFFVSQEPTH